MSNFYSSQLVTSVPIPNGFLFRPDWAEVHPSLVWAWLTMGEVTYGKESPISFVEGRYFWAYDREKPVRRNSMGEYRGGVGTPADECVPYRHIPGMGFHLHVPLGIDYRQVLVERPKEKAVEPTMVSPMERERQARLDSQQPRSNTMSNRPVGVGLGGVDGVGKGKGYVQVSLGRETAMKVDKLCGRLNMSHFEVVELAIEKLRKEVEKEQIGAEKVE